LGNLKERGLLVELDVDGNITFNNTLKKWDIRACAGLKLLTIRRSGRLFVNTVINLGVPQNAGNFLTS
jgi:hypothetical protein